MRCPRCDRELASEDRFCGRCGLGNPKDGRRVDPLMGITIAGRYTIEKRIGVGGMGTVYIGTHTRLGQQVAVKVLHERYAEDEKIIRRFEKEALTYGQVSHPNLVGLHDYGRTPDGTFFMVLEYCPGLPLSRLLEQDGSLPVALAADIVIQVAQGLGAAHDMGIVHRDLKPENIILTSIRPGKYHARLLDFGIAKRIDEEGPRLTQAGMVFGTPEYMAPEQARGKPVDARSDLYSLGTLFYELLTGSPPFYGADKLQVMHRQAHEDPVPVQDVVPDGKVSSALQAVVEKAMAKDPKARFGSTNLFIDALESSMAGPMETPTAPAMVSSASEASSSATAPTGPVGNDGTTEQREAARSFSFHDAPHISARPPAPPTQIMWAALLFCSAIGVTALLFAETDSQPPAVALSPNPPSEVAQTAPSEDGESTAESDSNTGDRPHRRTAFVSPERMLKHTLGDRAHGGPAKAKPVAVKGGEARGGSRHSSVGQGAKGAQGTDDAAKAQAQAKARAEAKARADAKARAEVARLAAEKAREKKRKKRLSEGRKALRKGKLSRAAKAARRVLKTHPEDQDATRLQSDVARLRKAVTSGQQAFAGADCVKALKLLEPVLAVAPGVQVASRMVNDCRKGLPPRQL